MNLEQLIEEVNKDLDDSLDSGDITSWVNRALDDLTPIAKKESLLTTDITEANAYELPADLHEIAFVRVGEDEFMPLSIQDKRNKGYKEWGNTLYLQPPQESGLIELFYYQRLPHLSDSEDVPNLPESFHDLLILYAIGHSQYAEEEPERQMDALNRYNRRKEDFRLYMRSNSNETYQVRLVNPEVM